MSWLLWKQDCPSNQIIIQACRRARGDRLPFTHMTYRAFLKEYYRITDRTYADRMIWFAKDRERAWQRGQYRMSKIERRISIALQYLIPIFSWLPLLWAPDTWFCILFALLYGIINAILTDFSFIKIFFLYRLYFGGSVYGDVLYLAFLGEFTPHLDRLRKGNSKQIQGFLLRHEGKFRTEYTVLLRNRNPNITLIFCRKYAALKANGVNSGFRALYPSIDALLADMETLLLTIIKKP